MSEGRPLVSAVMVGCDYARFLSDSLSSVLGQDYDPIELIYVDNGSGDGSPERVRELVPAAEVSLHPGLTLSAARNEAVRQARGSLIAFIDADDIWPPGRTRALVDALTHAPATTLAFGTMRTFRCPQLPGSEQDRLPAETEAVPATLLGTALIAREVFDRVGWLRADLQLGEFGEWLMRARAAGEAEVRIAEVACLRRMHTASLTFTRSARTADYARAMALGLKARREARRDERR